MALSFPYSLAFFNDMLRAKMVRQSLLRFDQMSGSGDGRFWSEELARPLWTAEIALADRLAPLAHELEAKIDGLDGARNEFLFADPTYPGPSGGSVGLGGVTVSAISADRTRIALSGLPASYQIQPRDRFTIAYGTGKVFHGRFAESVTANGSGVTTSRDIRPYLALGVSVGASVEMVRPYFKAFITAYTPFNYDLPHGEIARGGSMQIQQRP